MAKGRFQSTQPSQAVTAIRPTLIRWSLFQSTQPSQAVTSKTSEIWEGIKISIHTALAGCDLMLLCCHNSQGLFQSTQPSQAVTRGPLLKLMQGVMSCHTAVAVCV